MRVRGLSLTTAFELAFKKSLKREGVQHVFLCIADHWEPKYNHAPLHIEKDRVTRWATEYPQLAQRFADCIGRPPQHTFFYPLEEYEPEYLEALAGICRQGMGDVEVHLHHDGDTADCLTENLNRFVDTLHRKHGLLHQDEQGRIRYGFIHGNWALDNSRPDGRWCGVNNEISVLIETGCYADFTMPSAPSLCQTSTVNSIYYATDDVLKPKSHDVGIAARVGAVHPAETLLMVQGPLALDLHRRKWGILPRIENGDLTGLRPPSLTRLQLWMQAGVRVLGRENWTFIKLHTHGAQEQNMAMHLGEPMREFHKALQTYSAERPWFRYYYVTASEMVALVHAAESGESDPTNVLCRKSVATRHAETFSTK